MIEITQPITLDDFHKVLFEQESIKWSEGILAHVNKSFDFLKAFSENKVIYGVNTGFGPMAQYKINKEDQIQLQYNLIRSHAAGSGNYLEPIEVKSLMLARLNTLSIGKSGVHQSIFTTMTTLINKNITPIIYEHGGVGASGDLVQLAHLALVLIGEGNVLYKGEVLPTASVFEQENIQPIKIKGREGLGLINGTSVMTGIGIVNSIYARNLLNWSVFCGALLNEIVASYDDHYSEALNESKRHGGQAAIAHKMRMHLRDSKTIKKREEHLFSETQEEVFKEKVQEYYSLRCIPQILGPVLDTIQQTEKILIEEVNSANDNPIVDVERQNVYHGGNFHGDYISLEMDKLKLVITKVSMLAERQLNYLLNSKINEKFPPFLNLGKLGLNFGMQGMQFTAVSTTAENQTLSNPMYVHSISNNNDNQDIVSMGTNAALMTKKVIQNAHEVLAIELIALVQAVYLIEDEQKLSSVSKTQLNALQKIIPPFHGDEAKFPYIPQIINYLKTNQPYL